MRGPAWWHLRSSLKRLCVRRGELEAGTLPSSQPTIRRRASSSRPQQVTASNLTVNHAEMMSQQLIEASTLEGRPTLTSRQHGAVLDVPRRAPLAQRKEPRLRCTPRRCRRAQLRRRIEAPQMGTISRRAWYRSRATYSATRPRPCFSSAPKRAARSITAAGAADGP